MVRMCCICKLEHGQVQGVSFHRIPTNSLMQLKWFLAIRRTVGKHSSVCSRHFQAEDFEGGRSRNLLPTAVPSLLLNNKFSSDNTAESSTISVQEASTTSTCQKLCDSENDEKENPIPISDHEETSDEETHTSSTLKRKNEEHLQSSKRLCNARYVGDFRREDFISNEKWCMFRNHIQESKKKVKVLQQKVRRLNNKIQTLTLLLNHFKKKGQYANEAFEELEESSAEQFEEI